MSNQTPPSPALGGEDKQAQVAAWMESLGYTFYEGHGGTWVPDPEHGVDGWFCLTNSQAADFYCAILADRQQTRSQVLNEVREKVIGKYDPIETGDLAQDYANTVGNMFRKQQLSALDKLERTE